MRVLVQGVLKRGCGEGDWWSGKKTMGDDGVRGIQRGGGRGSDTEGGFAKFGGLVGILKQGRRDKFGYGRF